MYRFSATSGFHLKTDHKCGLNVGLRWSDKWSDGGHLMILKEKKRLWSVYGLNYGLFVV